MEGMETSLAKVKTALRNANQIVFLGGAGVSTGSGIPDFRSPEGLYHVQSKYGVPYEVMLSHDYFEEHPETFYEFYWESMVKKGAKPNAAHLALANYEKAGHRVVVLTQNIDGLHQDAGSKRVYELHGSTRRYFCPSCGKKYTLDDLEPHGVPHCSCGAILKPDVVLYGEPLDEAMLMAAVDDLRYSDVLIVGGTSLNVYPAAGLIDYFMGGTKIIINKEATPRDNEFDYVYHDDIAKILQELLS
jgi:NAD-dependent deacetylase